MHLRTNVAKATKQIHEANSLPIYKVRITPTLFVPHSKMNKNQAAFPVNKHHSDIVAKTIFSKGKINLAYTVDRL